MANHPGSGGEHGPARAGARVRCAGRIARGDPPGREPVAGPAGRGRDREDGAAGVPDRVGVRTSTVVRAVGVESEMELAFAEPASAVRADARSARAASGSAAPGAGDRVRAERRAPPGSVPRRVGGAEPVLGGGGGASAAVRRRRRAVARSRVGADAGVRRAAPAGRAGRDRVRGARAGRGASAPARAGGARPAQRRRAGAAGLGGAVHAGRAGARPDHRGDARQPAGVAGAAARVDGDASWPAGSGCSGARRCRDGSRRASSAGSSALPEDARRLLLVAAAEPIGDPLLLWRAAERLGIAPSRRSTRQRTGCWRSASA